MARYDRRIGPAEAGQGIGMALQSFAQQLQIAQERQKMQRENTFISDLASKLMAAPDQETAWGVTGEFMGKAREYGVTDPTRSLAFALQAMGTKKSKAELAREGDLARAAKAGATGAEMGVEDAVKARRVGEYSMYAQGRLAKLLTPENLMDEAKSAELIDGVRADLLAKNPSADPAEIDAAVSEVVSSARKERKEFIDFVREQNNLKGQAEILGRFKDFDNPQAFMAELGDDWVRSGGTIKSLMEFVDSPSEAKAAAKQLEYTQALIDQAKAATEDKKAMTELRGKLPISFFTAQLQGLNQRRNKLNQYDEPIMTDAEYQAEKDVILAQVMALGYNIGEFEAAASGEKVITVKTKASGDVGVIPIGVRLNNPGNLRFAGQKGAVKDPTGFAKFNSIEDGIAALDAQIALDAKRGDTLEKFITEYAPPSENDTAAYIKNVARSLDASPSDLLSSLSLVQVRNAIMNQEVGIKSLPLPSSKADLIVGQAYITPKGVLTWDGSVFK